MKDLFGNITKGAMFSDCRKYRYMLTRIWDSTKPSVCFIGLNPSTANEHGNDNTITKVMKIAAHNGYGGIYMLNLFPFVTPYPETLYVGTDLHHFYLNDATIKEYTKDRTVVFCWGNFKEAKTRGAIISIEFFNRARCLVQNQNGSPKHPLYCKDKTDFKTFIYPL